MVHVNNDFFSAAHSKAHREFGFSKSVSQGSKTRLASGGQPKIGRDDGDWSERMPRQAKNPGDENMELNAGLPRTAKIPNAAENDLDSSRDGQRLRSGGRLKLRRA